MLQPMGAHLDGLGLLALTSLNDTRTVSGIDIGTVHADPCAFSSVRVRDGGTASTWQAMKHIVKLRRAVSWQ